jgi:hypothetical protein
VQSNVIVDGLSPAPPGAIPCVACNAGVRLFKPAAGHLNRTSMFKKFQRWFSGFGAAIAKPDERPQGNALPEIAGGSAEAPPAARTVSGEIEPLTVMPAEEQAGPEVATEHPRGAKTIGDGEQANELNGTAADLPGADPTAAGSIALGREEIQRRRDLIRSLFNDFWSGRDDKPAAFVDRLDEAETYLNERLTASGENWRLDASTRTILGLPPRHARAHAEAR